jgi:hypothetical protein
MTWARWLASLAPPRAPACSGRPSSSPARATTGAAASWASIPGHLRRQVGVEGRAAVLGGDRGDDRVEGVGVRRAQVGEQLAGGRHDVERVARAQDRRHRGEADRVRPGSACAAIARAASASASRALAPFSGAEPECDSRPVAVTLTVPAPLRRTTTASSPSGPSWPASKHRHAS